MRPKAWATVAMDSLLVEPADVVLAFYDRQQVETMLDKMGVWRWSWPRPKRC